MKSAEQLLEVSLSHTAPKKGVPAPLLPSTCYVLSFHCTVPLRFHNHLMKQLPLLPTAYRRESGGSEGSGNLIMVISEQVMGLGLESKCVFQGWLSPGWS